MPEVNSELYRLIRARGEDAIAFLQGQLTQDVTALERAKRLLAAWCNAQGRVIVIVRLVTLDDGVGLVVPDDIADAVLQRLQRYRLRARVDLSVAERDDVTGLLDARDADPLALIRAGVPHIVSANSEKFTAHMLNLDRLGAVSFSKGCYSGQEIIARTQNLGTSRRRLMRYRADADGVSPGAAVSDGAA